MTTPMFDLFSSPKNVTTTPTFLMRAPLTTIATFLALRSEAVARIDRDTKLPGGVCSLYNVRGDWAEYRMDVVKAVLPLGAER